MSTVEYPIPRPGLRAWTTLVGAEMRMVIRDTMGLIIPIGLPMLMMVMNGAGVMGDTNVVIPGSGGLTAFDIYVMPLVLAIIIALIGVVNLPSFLAHYRKAGVLKRMSVSPARPLMVLGAQVIVSATQTIVGLVLALGVAMSFFGASLPHRIWLTAGVFALATLTMYSIGMLIAAVSPTTNSSVAIGMITFFAFGATGGMFGPVENMPGWLATVGETLPFGAAVAALGEAWQGNVPEVAHLVSLAVALVVSVAAAARFFRWQ